MSLSIQKPSEPWMRVHETGVWTGIRVPATEIDWDSVTVLEKVSE